MTGPNERRDRMNKIILVITLAGSVLFVSGCARAVAFRTQHGVYTYGGEKYGKVLVIQSDSVTEEARKGAWFEEISLDRKIIVQLKASGLYDEKSQDSITVLVQSIYIRKPSNSLAYGIIAGADSLQGSVTLNKGNAVLAVFDINASHDLRGIEKSQDHVRLERISDKFAELTVRTISGSK